MTQTHKLCVRYNGGGGGGGTQILPLSQIQDSIPDFYFTTCNKYNHMLTPRSLSQHKINLKAIVMTTIQEVASL